jgi:hypothetical protein
VTEIKAISPIKKVGRPKKDPNAPPKLKLKPAIKDANKTYYKLYSDYGCAGIYGIDKYTRSLIEYLWEIPEFDIVCTDPRGETLSAINRNMSSRSFSLYRWSAVRPSDFITRPPVPIIVIAEQFHKEVMKMPNKYNTKYVIMDKL